MKRSREDIQREIRECLACLFWLGIVCVVIVLACAAYDMHFNATPLEKFLRSMR